MNLQQQPSVFLLFLRSPWAHKHTNILLSRPAPDQLQRWSTVVPDQPQTSSRAAPGKGPALEQLRSSRGGWLQLDAARRRLHLQLLSSCSAGNTGVERVAATGAN